MWYTSPICKHCSKVDNGYESVYWNSFIGEYLCEECRGKIYEVVTTELLEKGI